MGGLDIFRKTIFVRWPGRKGWDCSHFWDSRVVAGKVGWIVRWESIRVLKPDEVPCQGVPSCGLVGPSLLAPSPRV